MPELGLHSRYSGLLECPCTDAFPRVIATAATLETGACPAATLYTEPQKCFAAAASLGLHAKVNVTVDSSTQHPAGCYATAVSGGYEVGFNANTSSAQPCGGGGTGARRRVAMADPDTKSVACTECHVDVDFQLASRPSSLNIQGEWQIVASAPGGNYNRFLVTIVFDPGSKNYTMVCNGPACVGAATTLGTGPVSADGTTYRGLPGVSGGAISPDNNEVRWDNGFALSRWFPAQEPATDVAGSYMVFVYGTRRTERDIAGTVWKVVGSNANFTVVAPGMPWTGTVQGSVTGGNTFSAWAGIPGAISGDFNTVNFYTTGFTLRRIDPASIDGTVTLTLAGPSDVWFGAGFMDKVPTSTPGAGAAAVSAMDNTYAVICAGDGSIAEFKLGHHRAGTVLAPSLAVVSNTVAGGVRQVVVTRKATGVTADHYTFDSTASNLGMINAVGNTSYVSYHRAHASAKLYYVDAGAPTCVCDYRPPLGSTASQGTLGSNAFASNCNPAPLSEMLSDPHWANATVNPRYGSYTDNGGVNPTCEIAAYRGGVKCCAGGTLLTEGAENRSALVAEAEYDHYQVMYRYYYEDATALAAAGKPVTDTFLSIWWTEHDNGEHDVPPCYGDPCVDTITSNFTGSEMGGFVAGYDIELVHVEGHCHVGCLGMELYNTDDPANPRLLCGTKIDYGQNDDAQNEMGCEAGRPAAHPAPASSAFIERLARVGPGTRFLDPSNVLCPLRRTVGLTRPCLPCGRPSVAPSRRHLGQPALHLRAGLRGAPGDHGDHQAHVDQAHEQHQPALGRHGGVGDHGCVCQAGRRLEAASQFWDQTVAASGKREIHHAHGYTSRRRRALFIVWY